MQSCIPGRARCPARPRRRRPRSFFDSKQQRVLVSVVLCIAPAKLQQSILVLVRLQLRQSDPEFKSPQASTSPSPYPRRTTTDNGRLQFRLHPWWPLPGSDDLFKKYRI
jgi:hypothetical protein